MQEKDVTPRLNIRDEHVRIELDRSNENTFINVIGEIVQVGDGCVMCVRTMGDPASADVNQRPLDGIRQFNRTTSYQLLRVVNTPETPICVGRLTWNHFPSNEDHVFTLEVDTRGLDRRDREYFLIPSVTLSQQGQESTEQVAANFQVEPTKSKILNPENSFVFRFHDRPAQLSVTFALEMCTQVGFLEKKRKILDKVTVKIATVVAKQKRFKKRKDRRNISCESDISLSDGLLKRLPQAGFSNESRKLSRISDYMLKMLHPVRDNGRWKTFEILAKVLEVSFSHQHSQITLQLERSEAYCFQGKLERADELLQEVRCYVNSEHNVQRLVNFNNELRKKCSSNFFSYKKLTVLIKYGR
mgnify:CR=1 FL=1